MPVTIIRYHCIICGKEFLTLEECEEHEQTHKTKLTCLKINSKDDNKIACDCNITPSYRYEDKDWLEFQFAWKSEQASRPVSCRFLLNESEIVALFHNPSQMVFKSASTADIESSAYASL